MGEDVIGNERMPIYQKKKRGILSRIAGGVIRLFAGIGLGGVALLAVALIIVLLIAELIIAGILTVYILTFAYGIFLDATLFTTYSIFTVPYFEVLRIGFLSPWWFWGVYVFIVIVRLNRKSSNKKKECKLK
jgi:hypothetical protein